MAGLTAAVTAGSFRRPRFGPLVPGTLYTTRPRWTDLNVVCILARPGGEDTLPLVQEGVVATSYERAVEQAADCIVRKITE